MCQKMTIPRPAQVLAEQITVFIAECNLNSKRKDLKIVEKGAKMSKKHSDESALNDHHRQRTD
jgi:hypothetical protein